MKSFVSSCLQRESCELGLSRSKLLFDLKSVYALESKVLCDYSLTKLPLTGSFSSRIAEASIPLHYLVMSFLNLFRLIFDQPICLTRLRTRARASWSRSCSKKVSKSSENSPTDAYSSACGSMTCQNCSATNSSVCSDVGSLLRLRPEKTARKNSFEFTWASLLRSVRHDQ